MSAAAVVPDMSPAPAAEAAAAPPPDQADAPIVDAQERVNRPRFHQRLTLPAPDAPIVDAQECVNRPCFHQRLTLPATDAHGELTVSYAVGGRQDPDAPTLLFIGGMFGGRFIAILDDYFCAKQGVRIVAVDRPGFGSSTPVPGPQRIPVWLETVPALLRAIGARHVVLAAHSNGTIYALNTLWALPHLLHPDHRALYLFAPWVPPAHSGVRLMGATSMLPAGLLGRVGSVAGFVNERVAPSIAASGAAVSAVTAPLAKGFSRLFSSEAERRQSAEAAAEAEADLDERVRRHCGFGSVKEYLALHVATVRRMFSEDTRGGGAELQLCMRKPGAGPWGECDSYDGFPARLDARLREALRGGDGGEAAAKVKVHALWADEDILVGKQGERYFDGCFEGFTEDKEAACLVYSSESCPLTDHDSVVNPENEVVVRVVSLVKAAVSRERN